jgi:TDG/mug DNA glycosylase family protein
MDDGSDAEVGRGGHDPERVKRAICDFAPRNLAFVGKQAARIVFGHPVGYGRQPESVEGTQTWVLPSTSGLARRFWSLEPWRALADAVEGPGIEPR